MENSNVTCIFTYALKARKSGRYNTMEQRFHLEHLSNKALNQPKPKKQTKTKGA